MAEGEKRAPFDPYRPAQPTDDQPGFGPAPGEAQQPGSASVGETMDEMTSRLQSVLEAAERAGGAIRREAAEQARGDLAEARRQADRLTAERVRLVTELSEDLAHHAVVVRDHSERMVAALEQAVETVTSKLPHLTSPLEPEPGQPAADGGAAPESFPPKPAAAPVAPPPEAPPDPGAVVSEPYRPPEPAPRSGNGPAAEGSEEPEQAALLHATRLAVTGSERTAIAASLRDEFGLDDPDMVLDRVLGPAGPARG